MEIYIDGIYKRYTASWVLKDISMHIQEGERLAVRGPNGSGKSTLIQIISGVLASSKGTITYKHGGSTIDIDDIFQYMSIHTAYTELDEELSAVEMFDHFKLFNPGQISDNQEFMEFSELVKEKNNLIKTYSSGMKQRLALALVLNSKRPLLILDEPGSFLDKYWKTWFSNSLRSFSNGKTMIIASNDDEDVTHCNKLFVLE